MVNEQAAAQRIRAAMPEEPLVAIVAGSGLGGLHAYVDITAVAEYAVLPGWPVTGVAGHDGRLVLGRVAGVPVAVACGRAHLYEGHSPAEVGFPIRALCAAGARVVVLTNAAGALDHALSPGDVVIISDHLFLPGMAGMSPIAGLTADVAPGFPSMVAAYDAGLRSYARDGLAKAGHSSREVVYAMVAGPSFETPAEARMLRALGADVVGMSTAPEAVVARQRGAQVLGLSVVTNRVVLEQPPEGTVLDNDIHNEVVDVAAAAVPVVAGVLEHVVTTWAATM